MRTTVLGLGLGCAIAAMATLTAEACQYHMTAADSDQSALAQVAKSDAPAPATAPVIPPSQPAQPSGQTQSE
jgi:hypothetical protein